MLSPWANKQNNACRCVEGSKKRRFFLYKVYNKIQPVYVTMIKGRRKNSKAMKVKDF